MPTTYKTDGLVLRRQPLREVDRLVVVMTPDRGKLELVARGAAKIKSKMAGHLEPYTYSRLMIAQGRHRDTIMASQAMMRFQTFTGSIIKKAWADYTAEIVDRLVHTNESEPQVFRLIFETWKVLDKQPVRSPKEYSNGFIIVAGFIIKLFSELGYKPELRYCSSCGQRLVHDGNIYDFTQGGIVCSSCQQTAPVHGQRLTLTIPTIKLLRFLQQADYQHIQKLSASTAKLQDLKKVIDRFLGYYINTKLRTVEFLRTLSSQKTAV